MIHDGEFIGEFIGEFMALIRNLFKWVSYHKKKIRLQSRLGKDLTREASSFSE